ncbi:MAG: CoA activase [Chloroflexi bacterium]|nr:CoA activase [Chloroflexota bacterium]
MITAGIDVGIKTVKAVIVKDGKVIGKAIAPSGGAGRSQAAEQVWQKALKQAKLTAADVQKVVATGQGKWDVQFANDYVVETLADTKGALALFPKSRSLIDIGADQARVIRYDASGKIQQYMLNQKCTAGLGTFIESIGRTLGMTVEEMGQPVKVKTNVAVNDQCAVFAELDVIGMVHENVSKANIVQAIDDAVATRLASMVHEMQSIDKNTALIGGVARNEAVVKEMEKRLDIDFMIPAEPEYAGALGAALIAASND